MLGIIIIIIAIAIINIAIDIIIVATVAVAVVIISVDYIDIPITACRPDQGRRADSKPASLASGLQPSSSP
jgi:hypothetical protein